MLDRFRTSLFHPTQVFVYATDKIWRLFLYIFIFSFIATLPMIFSVIKTTEVALETKALVKEEITNSDLLLQYKIENNQLVGSVENPEVETIIYGAIPIVVGGAPSTLEALAFSLEDTGVYIYSLGSVLYEYTYDELNMNGLELSELVSSDINVNYLAYQKLDNAIDYVVMNLKPLWSIVFICCEFIVQIAIFFIVSLLIAMMFKLMMPIKYSPLWKIAVYSYTICVVGQTFTAFLGLTVIDFLFVFIMIFFEAKAIKLFYFNEIIKHQIKK